MMRPHQTFAQAVPDDAVEPIIISKDTIIAGLQTGDFAQIAVFEMIGETFRSAMNDYVTRLRKEADRPITVVVLVEPG